jgi:L-idonate 5-dehydrogenase
MRACVIHRAKDLRIEDLPDPAMLQPDEVLVQLGAGGICGSDLHYFHDGGAGDFRLREPLVLGHEAAGQVIATGSGTTGIEAGQRVAVNPTRPCFSCRECRAGRSHLCQNGRFYGSAARFPHVQGAFVERFVASEAQCYPIPDHLSYPAAACAEPLAVALHAVTRAGSMLGSRVLVTGSGPIGVLVTAACRLAGAAEVVVTDLFDEALAVASAMGATETINVSETGSGRIRTSQLADEFHAVFEASGSPAALQFGIQAARPQAKVVQVGMLPPGNVAAPLNRVLAKELAVVGTFRFHEEFGWAVSALASGRIDVNPLLSAQFPLGRAPEAFALASDRRRAMKVSLVPDP